MPARMIFKYITGAVIGAIIGGAAVNEAIDEAAYSHVVGKINQVIREVENTNIFPAKFELVSSDKRSEVKISLCKEPRIVSGKGINASFSIEPSSLNTAGNWAVPRPVSLLSYMPRNASFESGDVQL